MTRQEKSVALTVAIMFGVFLVGVALERASAFSPVHEQFHVNAARERGFEITGRTHTSVSYVGGNHSQVILAGYYHEAYLWALLAFVLGRWGTLFAGYWASTWDTARVSMDFKVLLYEHLIDGAGWTESQAWAAVRRNLEYWDRLALLVAICLAARYVFTLWRVHAAATKRGSVGSEIRMSGPDTSHLGPNGAVEADQRGYPITPT